jgi:hypothetical protein
MAEECGLCTTVDILQGKVGDEEQEKMVEGRVMSKVTMVEVFMTATTTTSSTAAAGTFVAKQRRFRSCANAITFLTPRK